MNPLSHIKGIHKVVTLRVPGRQPIRMLCLVQKDASGEDAYYVLAERDGSAFKWRNMIKDNAVRRLRDDFVRYIAELEDADSLDVETIFFCTIETSKTEGQR